jgi:hypothetical protein
VSPVIFKRGEVRGPISDPHESLRECFAQLPASEGGEISHPIALNAGECAIWVFDLGVSRVCQGRARVAGALGGEHLTVSYAEKMRDGALVLPDPGTYCRMRPSDEFLLRPGNQVAEPFSLRGGRYIIFKLDAPRASSFQLAFDAVVSSYPSAAHNPPFVSDGELAGVAEMCRRSIEACLQDGFVDCVWRESSQWLGDCLPEVFAFSAMSEDPRPLERAIVMAAEGAYADGVLPSVLPGEVHAYTVLDYNFSWVELLAMYARHAAASNRLTFIAGHMSTMGRMLDRFDRDRGADGLIRSQPGRRLFLDWSKVDRREPSLTYNARYLRALGSAADIATEWGEDALASTYRSRSATLTKAMRTAFRPAGRWHENIFGVPCSQLGLALVILTGCARDEETAALADAIVARSLELDGSRSDDDLVLASPFMHHYVFLALEQLGRRADILRIIRSRWGRWSKSGEPTTWENWNVDFPDGSTCHGFSAHPLGWILKP